MMASSKVAELFNIAITFNDHYEVFYYIITTIIYYYHFF
jgi:hypothetical protein